MIDVVQLKARLAKRTGDVEVRCGTARLTGSSGTLEYVHLQPTKMTNWISADIIGIRDYDTDAVRIRFGDGDKQFYFDESMDLIEVTDTSSWDDEWSPAYTMGALELWTRKSLQLIVHLVSTNSWPDPRVSDVRVLMDHPTWEGAVANTVRDVAKYVGSVEFTLIHSETLSASRGSWKIGKPYTEHQYDVRSVVQVAVDGVHKSSRLDNGEVILEGPPAPAGSTVEIAVNVLPTSTVRRVGEVDEVHRTPEWFLHELVAGGGLTGVISEFQVGGELVKQRLVELRIRVNGVAHRQADALAMRLALQSAFANGLEVQLPSGRCVFAQLDGLVEVVEEGPLNLPMATGEISVAVWEYVKTTTVRKQLRDDGTFLPTELTLKSPDGSEVVFNETGFNC